jgi:putative ABC transport system ATP-binding protein
MIKLQEVSKTYYLGDSVIPVLNKVSLQVNAGEFVAIMGPSGSGKSTLMNIIGCLDTIDSGRYYLGNMAINTATIEELANIRNRRIGFVFQSFNLIPRISAQRNVELPMVYAGVNPDIRKHRALAALDIVGLRDRAHHSSAHLSGGQQQRVAIARSIVNSPDIIIADEPTGALDTNTSREIMHLFQQLNASGKTIVMVTHEEEIAAYAGRTIQVRDGVIYENSVNSLAYL